MMPCATTLTQHGNYGHLEHPNPIYEERIDVKPPFANIGLGRKPQDQNYP
jgi:hypothetical protein